MEPHPLQVDPFSERYIDGEFLTDMYAVDQEPQLHTLAHIIPYTYMYVHMSNVVRKYLQCMYFVVFFLI